MAPTQTGKMGVDIPQPVKIDKTRYFHQTLGRLEGDDYGNSIINTCLDQLKVLDSAQYSVGKIFYELTLKIYKSDELSDMSEDDRSNQHDGNLKVSSKMAHMNAKQKPREFIKKYMKT